VSPFDDPDIVAGQATVALEIHEALPEVASVVVPVGGGGLIAGVVAGLGAIGSAARVWGVEPAGAPKLTRALAAGEPTRLERSASIADGLVPLRIGRVPWGELMRDRERLAGVAVVEDDSIRDAVHYLWRECRLSVEPSGAATVAALRVGAVRPAEPVVLVVSGGNVDPSFLEAS
jgi:threonine dehydratase